MQETLRKLTFFALVLAAFVPLVNIQPWFAPAPWGQTVLLRLLVPFLAALFLIRFLSVPEFAQEAITRVKAVKWALSSFALFLGIYLLATVFSQDPHFSFWGNPDRAWGALNYALYVILGLVAFLSLTKQEWKRVWFGVFGGAVFLAFVAFSQRFALLPNLITPIDKAHATLGNPLLLGAYLVPLVFLLFGFILQENNTKKRWGYGVVVLLILSAVVLTTSRSALLGLGAGSLFFLFFSPVHPRVFRAFGLLLAFLGSIALLFLFLNPTPPAFLGKDTAVSSLWNRVTPQSILETERFAGWKIELEGIADRPLLGYGPYNSWIGFNKHFDPEFAEKYKSTGWWDTAHSMYIDIAAGTGLLGLTAFLAFIGMLLGTLSLARRKAAPEEKLFLLGAQAALIAYFAAMIPAFNSTATYLVFFILFAYALFLISTSSPPISSISQAHLKRISKFSRLHPNIQLALAGILCVLLFWFLYAAVLKPLVVNKEINVAQAKADSEQCEEALVIMGRSFPENSHFADYHRQRETDILGQCITLLPGRTKEVSLRAVRLLEEHIEIRPYDPRSWILLGGYLNNLTLLSLDVEERKEFAGRAETALARAEELSPKRGAIFAKRAQTYRLAGEYEKSKEEAARCLEIIPDLGDCWFESVLSGIAAGEKHTLKDIEKEAKNYRGTGLATSGFYAQLAEAYGAHWEQNRFELTVVYEQLVRNIPQSFQYNSILAQLYWETGIQNHDIHDVIELHERLVELAPDNLQFHAVLARLYRDLAQHYLDLERLYSDSGLYEKALEQVREMWRLEPTPQMQEQINAFIQSFPQP